ncbi:hypothetical protein [Photorhabdus sp. CRCIA-P01]|uniref:hypothetical protein n=1 Tax=Photorhabdus sp. CRCIA-P01 TaxID=2019570 RepID=UPI000E59E7D4|nr:hypothetical protein [Photorhabdus sp. CRCIA-P01]
MNNLFTQAENFSSAISGGVDPRTGLYNLNLSLGTVKGNGGLGPDFPVTLSYSPLAQGSDMGFGDGVSLGFSTYDASSGRLLLSTGEQYQVNWSGQGNKLNIRQKKLDSYHMEKLDGKAYKIIHCLGDLEFLQGFDYGGDLKLPKQLVSVEGYTLHIDSVNLNGVMYLSRLRDESETALLNIDYDGNKTTLTFYPDTLEGYSVVLTTNNGYLVAVGIAVTGYPPHRSGRALLTHPAPTSGVWRKSAAKDKDVQFGGTVSI